MIIALIKEDEDSGAIIIITEGFPVTQVTGRLKAKDSSLVDAVPLSEEEADTVHVVEGAATPRARIDAAYNAIIVGK